jgi:hypothetical protein
MTQHRGRELQLLLDGRTYVLKVLQKVNGPDEAVRLLVVSRLLNTTARQILRVCVRAIQRYTEQPYELWVIDNCSPKRHVDWLLRENNINVVLNTTRPIPPTGRNWYTRIRNAVHPFKWGSYENAIGLEIAVRLMSPNTQYLMSLHMDTMPCQTGWLKYLRSKLGDGVGAAGFRMDSNRTAEGVLHVLGCLIDFALFKKLGMDFLPRLPQYDVGDRITTTLRTAGYEVFSCPNTLRDPRLEESFPSESIFRNLSVDRSVDDDGNVVFLHLGRGTRKAFRRHKTGITSQQWLEFAYRHILA